MAWTPPTKFIVVFTFLLMAFGIFVLLDLSGLIWSHFLPYFEIGTKPGWFIVSIIVLFLSWFLFFLGIILKGL